MIRHSARSKDLRKLFQITRVMNPELRVIIVWFPSLDVVSNLNKTRYVLNIGGEASQESTPYNIFLGEGVSMTQRNLLRETMLPPLVGRRNGVALSC